MAAPIQSVAIPRSEKRTLPTPHVVYAIVVTLPVKSWTVYRRYSEFVTLHQSLSSLSVGAPPTALPPKHAVQKTMRTITALGGLVPQSESSRRAEEEQLQQRRVALERYLRSIVASTESAWRNTRDFTDFIELPPGWAAAAAAASSTPRNPNQPHRAAPQWGSAAAAGAGAAAPPPPPRGHIPGSLPSSATQAASGRSLGLGGFRRPGAATAAAVEETDETRALADDELHTSLQSRMRAQDDQLGDLAAVLRRQRAMGVAINQELLEQTEILDGLNDEVEGVQGKMRGAERQMKKLEG